ncbi:MAG TPA: TonB-dependent receptor plug domain-containing protein [Nitrospira sp.]|nr:TonB-dependent receptor plug domain-containing protein [Nitrospira sp.]HNK16237.1 TonB-dependent receptor plug domain-containing protein [Nitrospira sp.]
MTGALHSLIVALGIVLWTAPLGAHDPDALELEVSEIEVVADRPVAASSQQFIPDNEYLMQPQGRPAQVLRLIPGFVAVEHSGGAGKADQYFLRGFDADHGTDVAFFADGMPINFRSHAHGQGYTDLNFIIPETIEGVEVYKGAYLPEYGDFATAGAVNFRTREVVKEGLVQSAGGQFNTQRHLLMFSPTKETVRTLFAAEGYYTDGPFQSDNRYVRGNLLGKATMNPLGRDELVITGTFQKSQWNGSGEIPLRAVHDASLDRFGSIDPSEGGKTLRSTGRINYHYDLPSGGRFFANAYAQYYRFDLFTNFTFFLTDPVNGDGFQQSDRRIVYGGDLGYRHSGHFFDMDAVATVGVQARIDAIHARLGPQVKRAPLGTTVDSNIDEASYAPFLKLELQPTPWLRLAGGVRTELFTFDVRNRCATCTDQPAGNTSSGLVLPKMNVILGPWFKTEFFANYGEGYHSNDARSAVVQVASPLARARNYEVGIRSKPWGSDGVELIATLWALDLKQELVFVGDEGTTEIRGASRRRGMEVSARGQLWGPLYFNGSVTWTKAEFTNGDAIPLAPEVTAYGALLLRWPEGLTSQIQATYLGVRPLVEDRSAKAPSWTTFDLSERYQLPVTLPHGRLEAFLFVQNLFNTKWEQATFFFDSRLRNEVAGVADTHFVPGSPRFVMAGLAWYF